MDRWIGGWMDGWMDGWMVNHHHYPFTAIGHGTGSPAAHTVSCPELSHGVKRSLLGR